MVTIPMKYGKRAPSILFGGSYHISTIRGFTEIRWPALGRMSRRDMGKLCVRIHRKHTLTDLGDFKSPTTAAMATYMGKYIKYQTVNAKPQWIQVLRCGLHNMKFTKYRGPPPEPFLTFGGLDEDQAYILEERLDSYVYFVAKVHGVEERKKRNCFKCRSTTMNCFDIPLLMTWTTPFTFPPKKFCNRYERVETEQRKNSTQEYGDYEVDMNL